MFEENDGFGFDESDEDDEYCCVICGSSDCLDACICGAPLCYMHFELGAGFCRDQSEEHQRIIEKYYEGI